MEHGFRACGYDAEQDVHWIVTQDEGFFIAGVYRGDPAEVAWGASHPLGQERFRDESDAIAWAENVGLALG